MQLDRHYTGNIDTFHRGLVWYAMARRKKNRRSKSEAKKILKQVAKWANAGNPNVRHYHLMLRAEQAALERKSTIAEELYREAIVNAARTGHLHHAALFNERFSEYYHERGDGHDAKYYLGEAVRYYNEWGAVGKAEELQEDLSRM